MHLKSEVHGQYQTAREDHSGDACPLSESGTRNNTVDRLIAAIFLILCLPILVVLAIGSKLATGRVLDKQRRIGANGGVIVLKTFAGPLPGRRLPYLASVVTGQLRLIGPAPRLPGTGPADHTTTRCRIVPGLMSAHRLRNRTGIGYGTEPTHVEQFPLTRRNLGLMARFCVAEILNGGHRPAPEHIQLDGIPIYNTTMHETLSWSINRARERHTSVLSFVNADCLNQVVRNEAYRDVLRRSDRILADGIGVRLAARFAGHQVRENLNGTDLFPQLCHAAATSGVSLFLLGARPGIAGATADKMTKLFPGLRIAGHHHGYFSEAEQHEVIARINESGAGILLVAMGAPRQEVWIDRHRDELHVGLALGVGGLFDFYSGRLPRAPQWVREVGLEWAWRLAQEPGRMWRRYLVGNPRFITRTWWAAHRGQPVPDLPARARRNDDAPIPAVTVAPDRREAARAAAAGGPVGHHPTGARRRAGEHATRHGRSHTVRDERAMRLRRGELRFEGRRSSVHRSTRGTSLP